MAVDIKLSTDKCPESNGKNILNSKFNNFQYIDDDGKLSSASSMLTIPVPKMMPGHASMINEARRLIEAEASALQHLAEKVDISFAKAVDLIMASDGKMIISGTTKGGHVERKVTAALSATGCTCIYLCPDELNYNREQSVFMENDVFMVFSKTGSIAELLPSVLRSNRMSIPIIGLTMNRHSQLGEVAQILVSF